MVREPRSAGLSQLELNKSELNKSELSKSELTISLSCGAVPAAVRVPAGLNVRRTVNENDARFCAHDSDGAKPCGQFHVRRESREEAVVLSATEGCVNLFAAPRLLGQHPGGACGDQSHGVKIDARIAGPGQTPGINGETVRKVHHGGGPGQRSHRAERDGRLRGELRAQQLRMRPAKLGRTPGIRIMVVIDTVPEQQGEPSAGRPQLPRQRHNVAWAGAGAQHGFMAAQITECGHSEREGIGGRQVTADDSAAGREGLTAGAETVGDAFDHRDVCRRRGGNGDHQRGGRGPHGGDVGEVRCGGLPPEFERGRPGQAKIRAVNHHVGRDHITAVRCGENRGVVAWAEQLCGGGGKAREDAGEHCTLAERRQGCIRTLARGHLAGQRLVCSIRHASNGSLNAMTLRSSPTHPSRLLRTAGLFLALVPAALLLAGCTVAVPLQPADDATNSSCADMIVRLPNTVADQPIRETNAQATGAWGDPAAVLLHCGVAVPGPTTDLCVSINGIDWIEDDSEAPTYRYTTYGREPATEVVLDSEKVSGSTVLVDLSAAVANIPATGACTGIDDVTIPSNAP